MKKFYIALMMILATTTVWSQKIWDGPATGGSWNQASNWVPAGVPVNGDTILISEGVSGTITDVAANGDIMLRGFRIEGGSNVILVNAANDRTIIVDDEFGSEDFYVEAGSTLTLGGGTSGVNIILRDNYWTEALIAGTLIVSAGRTYQSDPHNTIGQKATRVTGIIENSGTVIGTDITLEFQDGGTYIHRQDAGTIPVATWTAASNCSITGVINTAPGGLDQAFGNFSWNCGNQNSNQKLAASGMAIAGTFSVANTGTGRLEMDQANLTVGNLSISGGTLRMASDPIPVFRTINVNGNVSISGGTLLMQGSTITAVGTLNVGGNFAHTGGTITEQGNLPAAIIFNGTAIQTFSKAPAAVISNEIDFTVNNNAKVDFGTSVLNGSTGNFTLSSGGKIITAHPNGLGAGATGSIQINRTFSNGADYEFQGPSTGNFSTGAGNRVRDLIINNTATGQVIAGRTFVVDRMLTLTNGYLTTIADQVTVSENGNAITTNGAFVNGPLSKITNSLTAFSFPVGKVNGGLRTIGITPTTNNNSTFIAEFFRAAPPNANLAAGLDRVSGCEYWDLDRTSGNARVTVTLSWSSGSACNPGGYVASLVDLRVAHLRGNWRNEGNTSVTGNASAGTVTSEEINNFSPFALASSSAANPLPVVFADVKAFEKNKGVQIEWSNLTEKDVASYTIERSINGRDFAAIGEQLPSSNQSDRADYDAFDASPNAGPNYYRVKAEETTGKVVYSKILSVNLGREDQGVKLYPNPVSGNQVTISLSNVKPGQFDLRVVNMAGQDIFKQSIINRGSMTTQALNLPASMKPGVYHMVITGGDFQECKMFIVQ